MLGHVEAYSLPASISGGSATPGTVTPQSRSSGYGILPGEAAVERWSQNSGTGLTSTFVATLAWQGRRMDASGYYNIGAREYNPTAGRFLSPDPLGQSASWDLYSYAGGDPINYIDCTGRSQVQAVQDKSLQPPTGETDNNAGSVAITDAPDVTTFDGSNGLPKGMIDVGETSSANQPVPVDDSEFDDVADAAFSNIRITAGGSYAYLVGGSVEVNKGVDGGEAEANGVVGFGGEIHAGVTGSISNPYVSGDPQASLALTAGVGIVAGIEIGLTPVSFGGINVPIPSQVNFMLGVGAGGEAKLDFGGTVSGAHVNVSNQGDITGGSLLGGLPGIPNDK